MGLNEVKEELLEQANRGRDSIIDKARQEALQIMEQAKRQSSEAGEIALKRVRKSIEENERREIAAATLESKKRCLAEEKRLIQEVMEGSRESLKKMKQREVLSKLLARAESELKIGKIFCSSNDAPFFREKYPAEIRGMIGGLIAENEEGSVSIDLSFDTLLETVAEKNSHEIHNALLK
ncbi:hypothetical protein HY638_06035 [Candidatus Woesearchaeota archaeon]|nr:hypothetical protein [Candidatus Woesearchaeota archaeon]